ncbi:MAG: hypothetical protein HKL89_01710 [Candidatus Dormibacteraeota bacterium]|nr:hypothetical protein [Candidatus Dormibacteraeota bacterium]
MTSCAAAASVELVDVDETVLSELVEVATRDAHAKVRSLLRHFLAICY